MLDKEIFSMYQSTYANPIKDVKDVSLVMNDKDIIGFHVLTDTKDVYIFSKFHYENNSNIVKAFKNYSIIKRSMFVKECYKDKNYLDTLPNKLLIIENVLPISSTKNIFNSYKEELVFFNHIQTMIEESEKVCVLPEKKKFVGEYFTEGVIYKNLIIPIDKLIFLEDLMYPDRFTKLIELTRKEKDNMLVKKRKINVKLDRPTINGNITFKIKVIMEEN